MRGSYYDPAKDETVQVPVHTPADISEALGIVMGWTSSRGHPTLELTRGDSSLSVSTDGERAYLVFVDSLGDSFHSTGGKGSESLVFDHFGSWSEAPARCLVSLEDAQRSAEKFALTGTADTGQVLFEPD